MSRNTMLKLSVLGIALAQPLAMAGEEPGLYLGLGLGKYIFDSEREAERANIETGHIGYQWNDKWAAEYVYLSTDDDAKAAATDFEQNQQRLDVLYHLKARGKANIVPYLSAGIGHQTLEADSALFSDEDEQTVIGAGAGLKWLAWDRLHARWDVRAIESIDEHALDFATTLTLNFHLGKTSGSKLVDRAASSEEASSAKQEVQGKKQQLEQRTQEEFDQTKEQVSDTVEQATAAVAAAANSVLDDDKDGVANDADQCLDTKAGAKVDEKGCYEVLKQTHEVNLEVNFANGSTDVSDAYLGEIKKVADFMTEYPLTSVTIEGHTDSSGSAAFNQQLSEKRATSVANALVEHFSIEAKRVSAVGYGEEKPIADNNTAEGKAKNRRVVAVVTATAE